MHHKLTYLVGLNTAAEKIYLITHTRPLIMSRFDKYTRTPI
jgi:hypothetical protein